MAILNIKKVNYVQRKISIKEENYKDLKMYIKFLGLDEKENESYESDIVNETLEYVFGKDKEFKKFKEQFEAIQNEVKLNSSPSSEE